MAKMVSRLRIIAVGADEALSLALHDTADFILTLIRAYVPVDTGWLRDSYQKESVSQLYILVGTMVTYSVFVEFGTGRQRAQPHLTPAFWQAREFFEQQFINRMKDLG
jgi:HK97 gp10 family phage protein